MSNEVIVRSNQTVTINGTTEFAKQTDLDNINSVITVLGDKIQGLTDNKENILNGSTYIALQGASSAPRTINLNEDILSTQINTVDTYSLTTINKTIVGSLNEQQATNIAQDTNIGVNSNNILARQTIVDNTLITSVKNIVPAINETNSELMQGFPFQLTRANGAVLLLGSVVSVPKLNGMFKKRLSNGIIKTYHIGNSLSTIAGNRISEDTSKVSDLGVNYIYTSANQDGTTTQTISVSSVNQGSVLLKNIHFWYGYLQNANALRIIGVDGTSNPPYLLFDITGLV